MQINWVKLVFFLMCLNIAACSTIPSEQTISGLDTDSTPNQTTPSGSDGQPASPPDQGVLHEVSLGNTPVSGELIGGSIEKSMNESDKIKMSRALDKAPGKTTVWENKVTGITYSVTPIKKVIIRENPFCREYQTTASQNNNAHEMTGIACIAADGNWHTVSRN